MSQDQPRIPIGQLLVLRDDFAAVAARQHESPIVKRRAEVLKLVLDELIDVREKEYGANG